MGMYTELIFGASLKPNAPNEVIDSVKFMIGEREEVPEGFPFDPDTRTFNSGSYYFAVNNPVNKMWYDEIGEDWRISIRANLKNYEDEIEKFLDWIRPFISQGSGSDEMYAIVIYEEDDKPTIYYLNDEDEDNNGND